MASKSRTGREYGLAVTVIGLTLLLGLAVRSHLMIIDVGMLFLLGVVLVAALTRRGPAIVSAILATAAFDFCFVPPLGTFAVDDRAHVLTLAVMLVVASLMGGLTARINEAAEAAGERERQVGELLALSRELGRATAVDRVIAIAGSHLGRAVGADADVVLAGSEPSKLFKYRRYIFRIPVWPDWPEAGLATIRLDSESRVATEEERRTLRLLLDQVAVALERIRDGPTLPS